jgi:hypothetical protein
MTPPSSTAAVIGTSTSSPASTIASTPSISTTILSPAYTTSLSTTPTLITLPTELQLNLLTYLRAYDLVQVQQVCQHFCNPLLIHKIVQHTAEYVYPPTMTAGFDQQPLSGASDNAGTKKIKSSSSPKSTMKRTNTKSKTSSTSLTSPSSKATTTTLTTGNEDEEDDIQNKYTFEHLHNMELLVVARVLSRPEPATGYFVSKSWCKSALRWLELQQDDARKNKKISKKKQRLRERRLSDVSPPWLNVNSDLLCEHRCLQRCSSGKSARARRKLLDKQAWKILKKLYPDSTQLESAVGECLHCTMEEETARKNERDRVEHDKLERKRPLANEAVRQFYTRTRGFPVHCLRPTDDVDDKEDDNQEKQGDKKMPAKGHGTCPLLPGIYQVLPRAWCHAWRRYIKTGEGRYPFPAPDAACLLCDEHRLPLLPPHLEAYLYGESDQLLVAGTSSHGDDVESSAAEASLLHRPFVPGQAMDTDTLNALRAAGLSEAEVASQLDAMRNLEIRNNALAAAAAVTSSLPSPHTKNELLDQENHSVVELLTQEEFLALEESWPAHAAVFCLRVAVDAKGVSTFSTPQCRACDATGRQDALLSVRNRSRSRMSAERALVKANLEY